MNGKYPVKTANKISDFEVIMDDLCHIVKRMEKIGAYELNEKHFPRKYLNQYLNVATAKRDGAIHTLRCLREQKSKETIQWSRNDANMESDYGRFIRRFKPVVDRVWVFDFGLFTFSI